MYTHIHAHIHIHSFTYIDVNIYIYIYATIIYALLPGVRYTRSCRIFISSGSVVEEPRQGSLPAKAAAKAAAKAKGGNRQPAGPSPESSDDGSAAPEARLSRV